MKENQQILHPAYRPDIDGLRGIAVSAVLLFHAFPTVLPGGFIGVDVFFVISGFLITTILENSIKADCFTFADFYGRRVRRIFPALIVVMVSCVVTGWFALVPADFEQLGLQVVAGATFISNFVFWNESSYFDRAAESKILLHLWSLAIEEQFYIVWPILLLVSNRLRLSFGKLILVMAVMSFILCVFQVKNDAVAAFFNPLTRAWELLVGAGLAVVVNRKGGVSIAMAQGISLLGAILIVLGLFMLNENSTFPGFSAFLPTFGAAVLLFSQASTLNKMVLGNRILVSVGLISYPLYLWHWPLLVFPRIIEGGEPDVFVRIGSLVVSVALAWITYVLLERRLRRGVAFGGKAIGLSVSMILCALAGVWIYKNEGLPERATIAPYVNLDRMLKEATAWNYAENSNCLNRYPSTNRKQGWWFCVLSKDAEPTIMIMGNSFANHLYPGIVNNPAFKDQTILQFGTCDPAMGIDYSSYSAGHPCRGAGRIKQEELSNKIVMTTPSLKVVLLSAPWPFFNERGDAVNYFDPEKLDGVYTLLDGTAATSYDAFMAGMERRVKFLIERGITPVLMLGTPELGYDPATCYSGQPFRKSENACVVSRAYQNKIQARFNAGIEEIKTKFPKLKIFNPLDALCDEDKCVLKGPNGPLLRDLGHLSIAGSEVVGNAFAIWAAQNLPEILLK